MNAIALVCPDLESESNQQDNHVEQMKTAKDVYFLPCSTDGPIPGPDSMLSFALVFAGVFDGQVKLLVRPVLIRLSIASFAQLLTTTKKTRFE